MRKLLIAAVAVGMLGSISMAAQATPEEDLKTFQGYFLKRFPNIPLGEFANGVYSIDATSRGQWESIEEFPPYEIAIQEGERMFNTPFKNGKTYASCFRNNGVGIAGDYPYFDTDRGEVITLPVAVNECRVKNGEAALPYDKGAMDSITSYMTFTSRGQVINVKIPHDQRAMDAYELGKRLYYTRTGQLNMACAHCHVDNSGNKLRANILSATIGQTSHFPVYRGSQNQIVNLHARFSGCQKQVRAKPYAEQSKEYRSLEYFMTYMSNGILMNGPAYRD